MDDVLQVVAPSEKRAAGTSRRVVTILAAMSLVAAGLFIATRAGTPITPTKVVSSVDHGTRAVDGGSLLGRSLGFGAPIQPQLNIGGIIQGAFCPILTALASGPFGAFLGPFIAALLVLFGCTSQ